MNTSQVKEIVKTSVLKAIEICETQVSLAKRAKITQGAIGKYIRGEALPKGQTANALSDAVDGALSPYDFAPHIFKKTGKTITSTPKPIALASDERLRRGCGPSDK